MKWFNFRILKLILMPIKKFSCINGVLWYYVTGNLCTILVFNRKFIFYLSLSLSLALFTLSFALFSLSLQILIYKHFIYKANDFLLKVSFIFTFKNSTVHILENDSSSWSLEWEQKYRSEFSFVLKLPK